MKLYFQSGKTFRNLHIFLPQGAIWRWMLSLPLSCVFCLQSTGVLYKCLNWQLSQEIKPTNYLWNLIIFLNGVLNCWTLNLHDIWVHFQRNHVSLFSSIWKWRILLTFFFVILCSVSSFYFDINQFRLFRCKAEHNVSSTFQMTMLNVKSIKILWRNR